MNPMAFIVVVLCKTTQYVIANALVMMVAILAMSKR